MPCGDKDGGAKPGSQRDMAAAPETEMGVIAEDLHGPIVTDEICYDDLVFEQRIGMCLFEL